MTCEFWYMSIVSYIYDEITPKFSDNSKDESIWECIETTCKLKIHKWSVAIKLNIFSYALVQHFLLDLSLNVSS